MINESNTTAELEPVRHPVKYVKVRGRLYDDNRLSLRFDGPIELSLTASDDPALRLWAELFDAEGHLRLRHPLAERATRTLDVHGPDAHRGYRRVHAHLPLPSGTAEIRFTRDGIVLQSVKIPLAPPSLKLTQESPRQADGPFTIRWESNAPVRCQLFYTMNGDHWLPISGWLRGPSVTLEPADLPGGGACRLRVRATDGFHAIERTTAPFAIPVKPCLAVILFPKDQERLPAGIPAILRGQGWWLEEQRTETAALRWESSVDGRLGDGPLIRANLSLGTHPLTLVSGDGPRAGKAAVTVMVEGGK